LLCSDGLSGMVRSDEMREVLLASADPLEACRELTDRANRAGGHDNITVIVADFDGAGLPDRLPTDELAYKKYALPEYANDGTQRVSSISADDIQTGAPSEEAARESRKLKVGHTMVGIQFALPDAGATPLSPAAAPHDPGPFGGQDEPVSIPVDGLPPALVGALVLLAMAAVALTGFWLLR
jgi:protein phosphatase